MRFNIELEGAWLRNGRLIYHPGRHLDVLSTKCGEHVASSQVPRGELVGIEPNPHRVVARTEDRDVADAVDARQDVLNVQRRIV